MWIIHPVQSLNPLSHLTYLGIDGNKLPWDVVEIDLGGFDNEGYIDGQLAVQYCREYGI